VTLVIRGIYEVMSSPETLVEMEADAISTDKY